MITQIRDYITRWNSTATPLVRSATADEIVAQASVKGLVDNNVK